MINGATVFGASNFNQNVTSINSSINLNDGLNTISVEMNSMPGANLWLSITKQVEAHAAAVIGPEGGLVRGFGSEQPFIWN